MSVRLPDYTGATEVTPSAATQTLLTKDKSLTSDITINAVTAAVDPDIQAGNIKRNVTILGVTGTVAGANPPYTGETTVTPSLEAQTLATANKDLSANITIGGVTAAIDSDIQAGNIKNGVNILGVVGTYGEETPPAYTGATSVTPSLSAQTLATAGKQVAEDITIGAVTAAIDPDIKATNIKSGVDILGVAGTMETATAYTGETTVAPDILENSLGTAGKNLDSDITISAVTASIDTNIKPENIKQGVDILGVAGTMSTEPTPPTYTGTYELECMTYAPFNPKVYYTDGKVCQEGKTKFVIKAVTENDAKLYGGNNIRDGVVVWNGTVTGKAVPNGEAVAPPDGLFPDNYPRSTVICPRFNQDYVMEMGGKRFDKDYTWKSLEYKRADGSPLADVNIKPGNLKKGFKLFGVTGTYE